LRRSVDDAISAVGEQSGAEAAAAFGQARGLAAQRFGILERAPGMAQAVKGEATPDKFIESNFIRGSVEDVANTLKQLRPKDRPEVRGAVLDWLRSKAVTGAEDTAKFSQSGLNRALEQIGERKLDLIFAGDREALAQLQALRRVGAYVQAPPVASGVNYSASGTTAIDFLDQASRLPLVGLLGRPGDIVRAAQVARSLGPVSPTRAAPGLLSPGLIERVAIPMGLLSSPVAAQAPGQFMENTERNRARLYR
jgi:hypothetical protein